MKKVFVVIVILSILSMTTISSADTIFKLRNNVEFGMTLSEVEARETFPLDAPLAHFYGYGEIANIGNSGVQYHFKDDKLQEVEINFGVAGRNIINDYGNISTLLQSKYGDPIGNKGGTSAVLRGDEFDGYIKYLYDIILSYEEWLIQVDGGFVKIDHFIANGINKLHCLSYSFFTNSEVSALLDDL